MAIQKNDGVVPVETTAVNPVGEIDPVLTTIEAPAAALLSRTRKTLKQMSKSMFDVEKDMALSPVVGDVFCPH